MGIKTLEINIKKIDHALFKSEYWLLNSGIQNLDKKSKFYGSVNAWYDINKKKYSFVYSEIIGYFLTLMVYLYNLTNNKKFINRALLAASWLIKNAQYSNGGFKCLFAIDKNIPHLYKKNLIYSFDNGVILNGLCSLYKVSKKKYLLNSATRCANWLVKNCTNSRNQIKPVFDILDNKFYDSDKDWSTTSGSYHTKVSIGLANFYTISKKKIYLEKALSICKKSLEYQDAKGRFISFLHKGGTNAHPHCYSAEGLWSLGIYHKNKLFLNASKKGLGWILSKRNKFGNIPRLYLDGKCIFHERADSIAQVLRLFFLHNNKSRTQKSNKMIINNLLKILFKYQITSKNKRTNGSFLWGKNSNGKVIFHSNSWVTFFSIQAFYLYKNILQNNKKTLSPFEIV